VIGALLGAIIAAPEHLACADSPLSLGGQLGGWGRGSGLGVMAGKQVGFAITARYALQPRDRWQPALELAVGTPIPGVGISAWGGLELRRALVEHLAAYTMAGLRTGFVGPLYYARHSDVFAGYQYDYSGPITFGPHLPIGIALTFGRVEAYLEGFVEIPLLPTPQVLLGGALGVRVGL